MARRNWKNLFQTGGGLSGQVTVQMESLEDDLQALQAGAGAAHDVIYDAKGDLAVASAADAAARLAVGGDGQVLTADSAQTLGVKWAAAAGGGDPISWTWVTKAADESVASNATVQNDDELFFSTVSGAAYEISLALIYASPTGAGTPDIRVQLGEDATLRGVFVSEYMSINDVASVTAMQTSTANSQSAGTAASNRLFSGSGNHVAAGGTFRVLWAQATSDANATIVRAGSVLRYRRIV